MITTRERILDTAMEVFAQYGYRRASMDQVAAEAGLTRQAVYHHFGNKQALFRAVVEALHEGAYEAEVAAGLAMEQANRSLADIVAAQIDARFRYIIECLEETPQADELLSEHLHQTRDLYENFVEHNLNLRTETIVRVCRKQGLSLPKGMSAPQLARSIQIAVRGFNDLRLGKPFLDDLVRVVRLIVMGAVISGSPRRPVRKPGARKAKPRSKKGLR